MGVLRQPKPSILQVPLILAILQRRVAENGTACYKDNLYQKGLSLTMEDSFSDKGRVKVELSIALRGLNNDFDPGGVAFALKAYPQIGFTWCPISGSPWRVKSFHGIIRIVTSLHHHGSNDTTVSVFTDSNVLESTRRRLEPAGGILPALVRALKPTWASLFDYQLSGLAVKKSFIGVVGPGINSRYSTQRSGNKGGQMINIPLL